MTAKKSTKKSTLDLAAENVQNIEDTISSLSAEIEPLQKERDQLTGKALLNGDEVDRLADLTEGSLPRREEYLEHLRTTALPEAVAVHRREELLALAEDGVDGIKGKYEQMTATVADAEHKTAEAVAEARQAVEKWNAFIGPLLAVAEEAGQDSRNPADPDHPVSVVIDSMYPRKPLYVTVHGENYGPANADHTARKVAGKADRHLAEMIRLGAEEAFNSEARRGRWG